MENNTRNRSVFAVSVGRGLTTKEWRRVGVELDGWGAEALTSELERLTGDAWLWSAHTWRDDERGRATWEAASCLALDLDYADASGAHAHVPDETRPLFDAALRTLPPELATGEVLAHHTPRGARVVLLLDAPITDRELYARAATATNELVARWLGDALLLADKGVGRAGYTVDEGALLDLARVLWAPNATKLDPKTGEREVRSAAFGFAGTRDGRLSASQLAALAPAPMPEHAPREAHPAWASIRDVLLTRPGSSLAPSGGVRLCCPVHGESNASAIVFPSGVLACMANGCPATSAPQPLAVWAREHGVELLGAELARIVTGTPEPTPTTNLGAFWRTVAEWQADDGSSWFDEPPPAREWLLTVPENALYPKRRVLPRGIVGMLAAGGSVGKTMALTQLAVAVATGRRWLECRNGTHEDFPGFETPEGGGGVLLALGEEDAGEARRRLHAAVMGTGLTREEKALVASRIVVAPLMGQGVQLIAPADKWGTQPPQPTAFALELRARLMKSPEPWSLVVIDPLSRWAGPDTETDNAAATKFVQLLETFTKAPGTPTVLVAHHTTKGARREGTADDTAARGASALSDGVRWHAHMTARPHPEGVHGVGVPRMAELRVVKTNYGLPLDETLWLARDEGGWLRAASRREKAEFVEAEKAAKSDDKPARTASSGGALRVTR
jgi:RecA-family ATPase